MPSLDKNVVPEATPEGFTPGEKDVVIGKGKKYFNHSGNHYLRLLVASMMDEYAEAQTKPDKSNIITKVVNIVRKEGSFVKKHMASAKWVFAEDLLCREKVSQTFRDTLHQNHKPSDASYKSKRSFDQYTAVSNEEEDARAFQAAKRMRMRMQRAPAPIPSHLFDLGEQMPPLGQPNAMQCFAEPQLRESNVMSMSAFVNSFDFTGACSNDFETPLETTPIEPFYSFAPARPQQEPNQGQSMALNARDFFKTEDVANLSWKMDRRHQQARRNSIYFDDDISVITNVEDDVLGAQNDDMIGANIYLDFAA